MSPVVLVVYRLVEPANYREPLPCYRHWWYIISERIGTLIVDWERWLRMLNMIVIDRTKVL
jgi:hypothetical protein